MKKGKQATTNKGSKKDGLGTGVDRELENIAKKVQKLKGTGSIWSEADTQPPQLGGRAQEVEGLDRSRTMSSLACSLHTGK